MSDDIQLMLTVASAHREVGALMCEVLMRRSGLSAPCVSRLEDDGLASSEPQIQKFGAAFVVTRPNPMESLVPLPSPRKMNGSTGMSSSNHGPPTQR